MVKGAKRSQKMNLELLSFWRFVSYKYNAIYCNILFHDYLLHFWDKPEFDLPVSRTAQNLALRCVFIHLTKEVLCEYYQEKGDNLLHKIESCVHICLFYGTLYLYRWVHISTALLSKCIIYRNREKIDYFKVSGFFYKMYWYISSS